MTKHTLHWVRKFWKGFLYAHINRLYINEHAQTEWVNNLRLNSWARAKARAMPPPVAGLTLFAAARSGTEKTRASVLAVRRARTMAYTFKPDTTWVQGNKTRNRNQWINEQKCLIHVLWHDELWTNEQKCILNVLWHAELNMYLKTIFWSLL